MQDIGSQLVHVTQQAALACMPMIGSGDKHEADRLATEAMRTAFQDIAVSGTVVIGEGERDEAPMLYIGEEVGAGGPAIDIAVDPLEGTNLCAYQHPGAITVLAVGPRGTLLHAPDTYMDKWVVGSAVTTPISLDMPVPDRIQLLADTYNITPEDVRVIVLDRERNAELINAILATGAKVKTIADGDVCGGIDALFPAMTGMHALMGIGAAPEGTITAVACRALAGQMAARLMPYDTTMTTKDTAVCARMETMGLAIDTVYTASDLAKGDDLVFVATGVTDGTMIQGLAASPEGMHTHTLVLSMTSTPIQWIQTVHI